MASTLVAALVGASASEAKAPLPVTFVGDSVSASIAYVPAAQGQLRRGLKVRLDLRVCRRLVQPSCSFQGFDADHGARGGARATAGPSGRCSSSTSATTRTPRDTGQGIDRVMRAALAQGAVGVVWVTLRETQSIYHWTNIAIRSAAKRWPQLVVADWNSYASGEPWFGRDGLHLTATGASRARGVPAPVRVEGFRAGRRPD